MFPIQEGQGTSIRIVSLWRFMVTMALSEAAFGEGFFYQIMQIDSCILRLPSFILVRFNVIIFVR